MRSLSRLAVADGYLRALGPNTAVGLRLRRLAVLSVLIVGNLLAQTPSAPAFPISEYLHFVWSLQQGFALPPIAALAQPADGYLWLGTQRGLWRFDGVAFVRWTPRAGPDLASDDIRSLAAARKGGLWIGTASGLSLLQKQKLVDFSMPSELKASGIRSLLEDSRGGVWAGGTGYAGGGLALLKPPWKMFDVGGQPGLAGVTALFEDSHGLLWMGTSHGLYKLSSSGLEQFPAVIGSAINAITEDHEGRLIIATAGRDRILKLVNGRFQPIIKGRMPFRTAVRSLLCDRSGVLWAATFGDGLWRIHDDEITHFGKREGLSGPVVQALLEDREGNVWVGTRSGLDRFRRSVFSRLSPALSISEELITSVLSSRDGSMWVGTAAAGLKRITPTGIQNISRIAGLPVPSILSICEGSTGRIWVGTMRGLAVGSGNHFQFVQPREQVLDRVVALAGNAAGKIWAADARRGLFMIDEDRADPKPLEVPGLPKQSDIYALLVDRSGTLWIGYYHGGIAAITNDKVVVYPSGAGPAPGAVVGLFEDSAGTIWAGSEGGLSRFRNHVWTTWTAAEGIPGGWMQNIIGDRTGNLWLTTESGILCVRSADLAKQKDGLPGPFPAIRYSLGDGVKEQLRPVRTQPRAALAADGSLWFATEEGVAVANPRRVPETPVMPPRVVLDSFKVDGGVRTPADEPVDVKGREFEFQFTGSSLTSPDYVSYRYQLQGFDQKWIDAGVRRDAHYMNLPPADYKFRIVACQYQNFCGPPQTLAEFRVMPALYQKAWFRAVVIILLAASLWALHALRMRFWAKELTIQLRAQYAERTRIARELHDTLLQCIVAISLQLEQIVQRAPTQNSLKADLQRVRHNLDDSLREARDSVQALRFNPPVHSDLPTALRETGMALTSGHDIHFSFYVQGASSVYPDEVESAIVCIAREAINNAVRHSGGSQIQTKVVYNRRSLRLEVSDNGKGLDANGNHSSPPGHFGIIGIRERAEFVNARISISNRTEGGTTIVLDVPRYGLLRKSLQTRLWRLRVALERSKLAQWRHKRDSSG